MNNGVLGSVFGGIAVIGASAAILYRMKAKKKEEDVTMNNMNVTNNADFEDNTIENNGYEEI